LWLEGIPILAHSVGSVLRVWMWCQRNRGLAVLAALLVLALIGGTAGIAWKWREADCERHYGHAAGEGRLLLGVVRPTTRGVEKNHARIVRELRQRPPAQ
jgi:hypothetical protein